MDNLLQALRALSDTDRGLIADTIGDTYRHVDEDVGDDAEARRKAYLAISAFVRAEIPADA